MVRLFSRITDYSIFYILIAFVFSCLPYFWGIYFYLGLIAVVPILWVPVEAILLARYATTPGRALFKLRLAQRLSFKQALREAAFLSHHRFTQGVLKGKRKYVAFLLMSGCFLLALFGKTLTYYSLGLDTRISSRGWVQYYSLTRGFTVNFPNDPKEQSKQLEIPDGGKVFNYEEISTQQTKDVSYSVSYMELPSKWRWAGSNTLLKGALDLFVKYTPASMEIIEREIILYQNHRALDFHLKKGDNIVRGRFILVDNTLYKLTVEYPFSLDEDVEQGSPFLDSFDLHPKGIS